MRLTERTPFVAFLGGLLIAVPLLMIVAPFVGM
jgi:hypothetical protein